MVVLPHVFQDASSLISQIQNLVSLNTNSPLSGQHIAATRGGLYPLVVTSTVVSFAFFCIFILKFPFYQWMKWLDSRSNDLSRHAWRGGSINMRIGEEGTRAFIITWGHTHKSATSRKVSPGLKNDNFSNPSGAHKINLKSCYQKIFT